jgi:hypothetical protein
MSATGYTRGPHQRVTFHAFPSALERLLPGIDHYAFYWDLGPALQTQRH